MKILLLTALLAMPAGAEIPAKVIARAKSSVVSIERQTLLAINGEKAGKSNATGFIVDLAEGVIATNRHVTGTSPAKYRVTFRDGSTAQGRLLYYDPFNDFAFLKVSTDSFKPGVTQAAFAPAGSLAEGSEVFLVGNNENYEYSVKTGKVVNLAVHKPPRQTLAIQTSFDRTGGASGSPVFDVKGHVAAIHNMGSDTSSFEVPAVYLTDALQMLKAGGTPRRGEPWAKLSPVLLSEAVRNLKLDKGTAERIRKARPGTKRVLLVDKALPPGRLNPGDVIISVGGAVVGEDSYLFDKLMDCAAGAEAELEVYRNGALLALKTPVGDAQALKVRRFITVGGGLFTPYTPETRLETGENSEGALMVWADKGSPFYRSGTRGEDAHRILFTEFNGVKITGFEAFEKAAAQLQDKAPVNFISINLNAVNRSPKAGWLNADLKFWPLKTYAWDQNLLDWEVSP
jgi:S1-C subfamily serine protease